MEVGVLLKENNIDYLIEESPARFNPAFVDNGLEKEFTVKIKKEDFAKAEKIQEKIILDQLDHVDSDYYLFNFSDQELMEILTNRYEWGQFDFLLAQKLLKERGTQVSAEELETLKDEHLSVLAAPEESEKGWIMAGYISVLFGGLIGIVIGWFLYKTKKMLPNGDIIYSYSETDRKHGFIIFSIGIVVFTLGILYRLFTVFVLEK